MKISVIGSGYVGLVSGACFTEFGHNVICADLDQSKIDALNNGRIPIFEPGLDQIVERNSAAGSLSFTTNVNEAVSKADVVFIAVGTPLRAVGGTDMPIFPMCMQRLKPSPNPWTVTRWWSPNRPCLLHR